MKRENNIVNKFNFLLAFFLFSIFNYCVIRAIFLSITHDEAITVIYHAQASLRDIFYFNGSILANNHLLNTVMVKFLSALFGFNEFVVRLPALLGAALYLSGVYVFSWRLFAFNQLYRFSLVFLLVANPFLVDFLSLSRGYSLALGFFMWGLCFVVDFLQEENIMQKRKKLFITSFLFGSSVLSNLVFLNIFLAFLVTLLVVFVLKYKEQKKYVYENVMANYLLPIMPSILFILIIFTFPVLKMARANELYFGGVNGFWGDTINSLVKSFFYNVNYSFFGQIQVKFGLFVFIGLFAVILYYVVFRLKKEIKIEYLVVILFSVFTWLSIEFQFMLLGTKYVVGRAALFFLVFGYILIVILASIAKENSLKCSNVINICCFILVVVFFVHFLNTLNYYKTYTWSYDSNSKDAMLYIKKIVDRGYKVGSIGASKEYWPSLNFYKFKYDLNEINLVGRSGPDGKHDVYYLTLRDLPIIKKYNKKNIREYKKSGALLAL